MKFMKKELIPLQGFKREARLPRPNFVFLSISLNGMKHTKTTAWEGELMHTYSFFYAPDVIFCLH